MYGCHSMIMCLWCTSIRQLFSAAWIWGRCVNLVTLQLNYPERTVCFCVSLSGCHCWVHRVPPTAHSSQTAVAGIASQALPDCICCLHVCMDTTKLLNQTASESIINPGLAAGALQSIILVLVSILALAHL